MPLMTYLEMVDDILNDMDSEPTFDNTPLEDIASTEESRQVTQIIKTTYYNIIDGKDWPHLYKMFQLTETDASSPTKMTIPTNVMDFDYIKFDIKETGETRLKFSDVTYKSPKDFMDMLDRRDNDDSTVTSITDATGIFLNIYNERHPQYWTSFDDRSVVFDAYDQAIEAFLQTEDTQCRGKVYPTVTETDAFVFDLPVDAFSYLLAEAKSVCFNVLKQQPNAKAEQQSTTQRRRMSAEAHKINSLTGINYPNYGRTSKK
jgi:hypothetical protein